MPALGDLEPETPRPVSPIDGPTGLGRCELETVDRRVVGAGHERGPLEQPGQPRHRTVRQRVRGERHQGRVSGPDDLQGRHCRQAAFGTTTEPNKTGQADPPIDHDKREQGDFDRRTGCRPIDHERRWSGPRAIGLGWSAPGRRAGCRRPIGPRRACCRPRCTAIVVRRHLLHPSTRTAQGATKAPRAHPSSKRQGEMHAGSRGRVSEGP